MRAETPCRSRLLVAAASLRRPARRPAWEAGSRTPRACLAARTALGLDARARTRGAPSDEHGRERRDDASCAGESAAPLAETARRTCGRLSRDVAVGAADGDAVPAGRRSAVEPPAASRATRWRAARCSTRPGHSPGRVGTGAIGPRAISGDALSTGKVTIRNEKTSRPPDSALGLERRSAQRLTQAGAEARSDRVKLDTARQGENRKRQTIRLQGEPPDGTCAAD